MNYIMNSMVDAARVRKFMVPFELVEREVLFERDGWKCHYCGFPVQMKGPSSQDGAGYKKGTMDHVVPISLGGSHTYSNLVTACSDCNGLKGDKVSMVDISILLSLVV